AAVSHSSKRWRVKTRRTMVRTTASIETSIWWARKTRLRNTLKFAANSVCMASRAIASLLSAAERTSVNANSNQTGTNKMQAAAMVQLRAEPGSTSQLRTNSKKVAG